MKALGFGPLSLDRFTLDRTTVRFGDAIRFAVALHATSDNPQNIVVDYIVHHQKTNGSTSPKVFKWKSLRFDGRETVALEKSHAFRPITTRTYYDSEHAIEIQANGESLGKIAFTLKM